MKLYLKKRTYKSGWRWDPNFPHGEVKQQIYSTRVFVAAKKETLEGAFSPFGGFTYGTIPPDGNRELYDSLPLNEIVEFSLGSLK